MLLPTFLATVSVLLVALFIDTIFGELKNSIHPVAAIGRVAARLEKKCHGGTPQDEKIKGAVLAIAIMAATGVASWLITYAALMIFGIAGYIVIGGVVLKQSFAIRAMRSSASEIIDSSGHGDAAKARQELSMIVRRETKSLDDAHMFSAVVETVSEGTVDGITAPLFYFALFGIAGAMVYRAANTLDSTVGYNDEYYRNVGWFSAKMDTLLNYIPARITAFLIIVAGIVSSGSGKKAFHTLETYHGKTESINAGWPMSAMAGVLGVRLEKPCSYALGNADRMPLAEEAKKSISIMHVTSALFIALIVIPLVLLAAII